MIAIEFGKSARLHYFLQLKREETVYAFLPGGMCFRDISAYISDVFCGFPLSLTSAHLPYIIP